MNKLRLREMILSALLPLLGGASPAQSPQHVATSPAPQDLIELLRRVGELERQVSVKPDKELLDLSPQPLATIQVADDAHVLAKPWYQNFDLWGFGAFGFLDTGNDGTRPDGGFLVKEATLHVEARAWEDISLYGEVQLNRLGQDASKYVRTGEVHAHFRNVFGDHGPLVGVKIGRMDIPFGDEYLAQDAVDNPFISHSAAYPYGFDEGIVVYGEWSGVGWVTSLMDGTDDRSLEDDPAKAVTGKLYGSPTNWLDLSASFMTNGDSAESAIEFGGSHIEPVGAGGASTAGVSSSEKVDSFLYEIDARCSAGAHAQVALTFGQCKVDDDQNSFDRDLKWFRIEPRFKLSEKLYLALRWSEIGTYDSADGYHFDGKIIAGGNSAFGYDTQRFQRLSAGLGWQPNPHTTIKLEIGQDRFEVIDASPFEPDDDDRVFAGFEVVLGF